MRRDGQGARACEKQLNHACRSSASSRKDCVIPPSSILCRAQEALQRARAAASTLESVRAQAEAAAAVWAKEAIAAEHREQRKIRTAATRRGALETATREERDFSENPDRGFAHA